MPAPFHIHEFLHLDCGVTISDVRCRAPRHAPGAEEQAPAHRIVFVRRGIFQKQVGSREVVADSNQALFFNRNEPYRVAHPVDGGDDCTVFEFEPALVCECVAEMQPRVVERPERPFEFTHTPIGPALYWLQQRLRTAAQAGGGDALAAEELALDLLAGLVGAAYHARGVSRPRSRRRGTSMAHRALVVATQTRLAQCFADKLTVPELARLVHSSPFHLTRVFRAATGMAIHEYRNHLRLRQALVRITDGEEDLARLALELGYASHSHLTDAFRRAFGVSPSVCRQQANSSQLRKMSRKLEVGAGLAG